MFVIKQEEIELLQKKKDE